MTKSQRKNPFKGINPILHTILQDTSKSPDPKISNASLWPAFHSQHLTHLADAIQSVLPPGYAALQEVGLQISEPDFGASRNPVPDLSVWQLNRPRLGTGSGGVMVLEAPAPYVIGLNDLEYSLERIIFSIGIYPGVSSHMRSGRPVTRIELLSPSNKPGSGGSAIFLKNYITALKSGTSVIILDYLHETPSPLTMIPRYPDEAGSHAYNVSVADARTEAKDTRIYGFDVDSPIPALTIPLADEDNLKDFNFNAVYQYTYERGPWSGIVEREGKIERWYSYNRADQDRIIKVTSSSTTES